MQRHILAVSPDAKLLGNISAHLQEGGRFLVDCISNGKDALSTATNNLYDLAIMDADINDMPVVLLSRELVSLCPSIKLLVFPPQNNPKHPALNGLIVNGYLNKPFFGPEISEKIMQALNDSQTGKSSEEPASQELPRFWVEDPESGQKQIEQFIAATTASGGLLLIRGQVIAGTGALSEEITRNIVNFLNRYWMNIQTGELFRYLSMENELSNYLIYASPLIKDVAIALIYHTHTSLQDIRGEVYRLRKAFQERYLNTGELRQEFPVRDDEKEAKTMEILEQDQKNKRMITHRFSETNVPINETSSAEQSDEETGAGLSEEDILTLNKMLAEMPPPDPDQTEIQMTVEQPQKIQEIVSDTDNISEETPAQTVPLVESMPPLPEEASEVDALPEPETFLRPESEIQPEAINEFPDFDFKLPWEEPKEQKQTEETPYETPSVPFYAGIELPEDFQTIPTGTVAEETASKQNLQCLYNFVLIPADPNQYLSGELSKMLAGQMPQLLSSLGWQITAISIRPQYLQWTVEAPLFCNVSEKLSDVRLQLNTRIFTSFPELLTNNPEGDFWLPGYLGLTGSIPPSKKMISDFIAFSRKAMPSFES